MVNCYLLKTEAGFFLVDTGMTNNRRLLEIELNKLGCYPGNLKLILLTHGDFDHTGSAVFLREKYGSQICMHAEDVGMLENGDMFYHRKFENRLIRSVMRTFLPLKVENRGKPDVFLEDGTTLFNYGLDATVYNTPGHSTGSVCILTSSGDLFAGDLLTNSTGKPMLNSMMYDKAQGNLSLKRLKQLPIQIVYPGHGEPFGWQDLL
jgi:glyoxylase-like metal-dependent hydrolase (beta-lactamase superfamily II)